MSTEEKKSIEASEYFNEILHGCSHVACLADAESFFKDRFPSREPDASLISAVAVLLKLERKKKLDDHRRWQEACRTWRDRSSFLRMELGRIANGTGDSIPIASRALELTE